MNQPQSITSLPESPDVDRHRRMVKYFIAMAIRVACIILCFFVHGWWLLVPIIGALVLPYIAVVFANIGSGNGSGAVDPGVPAAPAIEAAPSILRLDE